MYFKHSVLHMLPVYNDEGNDAEERWSNWARNEKGKRSDQNVFCVANERKMRTTAVVSLLSQDCVYKERKRAFHNLSSMELSSRTVEESHARAEFTTSRACKCMNGCRRSSNVYAAVIKTVALNKTTTVEANERIELKKRQWMQYPLRGGTKVIS